MSGRKYDVFKSKLIQIKTPYCSKIENRTKSIISICVWMIFCENHMDWIRFQISFAKLNQTERHTYFQYMYICRFLFLLIILISKFFFLPILYILNIIDHYHFVILIFNILYIIFYIIFWWIKFFFWWIYYIILYFIIYYLDIKNRSKINFINL